MELAPQVIRMVFDLANLDVSTVRRPAGDLQTVRRENLLELPIKFKTMAVPLAHLKCAVSPVRKTPRFQNTRPRAQAHRTAQFVDALQFPQFVNDPLWRDGIELC